MTVNNQPRASFCHKCGTAAHPGADFCMACGERLIKVQAPAPAYPKKKKPSSTGQFFLALAKCGGYYGFYLGIQLVVLIIASIICSISVIINGGGIYSPDIAVDYLSYVHEIGIVSGILTLIGYFIFFKIKKKSLIKEISPKPLSIGSSAAMVVFGFCAQIIIGIILALFYSVFVPGIESSNESVDMLFENGNIIVQILNVSIITGLLEEVIFRGLIHNTLKKIMPLPLAIFLSSVLFGAAHMNLEQFFYTSLLGVLLALVYEKKGSILAPALIHMAFNGSNFVTAYLNFESDLPYLAIFLASIGAFLVTAGMIFFTRKEPENSLNIIKDI